MSNTRQDRKHSKNKYAKDQKKQRIRHADYYLYPIQHAFQVVDMEEGIIEVEDDIFQRVQKFIESKTISNVN